LTDVSLDDIDLVRRRAHAGYFEAKEALERSGGDVVDAIIWIEEERARRRERLRAGGEKALRRFADLVREGNVTRVRVLKGRRTLFEVPATVGVAGALLLPTLAGLGVAAAFATGCTIEVERRDREGGGNGSTEADA